MRPAASFATRIDPQSRQILRRFGWLILIFAFWSATFGLRRPLVVFAFMTFAAACVEGGIAAFRRERVAADRLGRWDLSVALPRGRTGVNAMHCLYRGDYGPPAPGFNPGAGDGVLLRGFESHRAELMRAKNLGQLEAMERQLLRGEQIQWCDQGYGWTYQPRVDWFFDSVLILVVAPWFAWRVARPALSWARRRAHHRAIMVKATS